MAWHRARSAFDDRDYETALRRVEAILAEHPTSFKALALRRDILGRRGEITAAAQTVGRMRRLRDDPRLLELERGWLGRLVETDPRWLPLVPGPPQPVEPRGWNVVMHLLKESVPYHQNGFTMRSNYIMQSQRDAGLEPFVVSSLGFPRKDGIDHFPGTETVDGIVHHRLDLGPGYPLDAPLDRQLTDYAWLAAKVARRERPAIIHAASGFRGFETALVGRALREHIARPLVYEVRSFFETTWSADVHQAELGEHYRLRFETENRCMQAADAVVTIAEAMRQDIAARGVPPERIHVMPNGVDPEAFQPMERDPELVHRYGLEDRFAFGYVSNLDHPREGQELLIEATAKLRQRGRKVACLIVGDGRRREELEHLARRSGAGSDVHFTGRVPHAEVRAHYALLDAFVVPRRNDRAARYVTPLKPFEAMAMARPLVVADLPALAEIATPGERGLAFRVEDADALATELERLMDDPELARRLGEAGRAWVLAERTWARNGARYRDLYADVLERWDAGQRIEAPQEPAVIR
jgi:glycosyltransferase involved in cell wall biosynthesis